jgi:hypothetical protein
MGQGIQKISNHFDYARISNREVPTHFQAVLKRIKKTFSAYGVDIDAVNRMP